MHILIKKKKLIFKDYRIKCALGKRGIGVKKKEGDLITPLGLFKIKYILYRKDRVKNLITSLKKIPITKKMGWCDDSNSKKYNQLIKYPSKYSFEKLYRRDNVYDIVIVLNYNMNPTKKNKGSAIFIHIAKKNYKNTEGCVAIKKTELIRIAKYLRIKSYVRIT
tara:strand:- start:2446 stop:2937 length:492 start_codon:yes stop_codon:yes gene_type:complete